MIVDSSGSRQIATIERRPIGEFDQTPEFWRCNTCENINCFDDDAAFNGFLAPKVSDYMEDMRCKKCGEASFTEDSWVVNPFFVYLGTWNGRVVAEGGPWHWSLEWHRDCAPADHTKEDCYATRKNGRRRRENPCISKAPPPESKGAIPPILVVDTDRHHSLPPPSAGLTPFPEEHDYGSDRDTVPDLPRQPSLTVDNQTLGTGGFTIGDYADDNEENAAEGDFDGQQQNRGLEAPYDDQEPDLGSYYDAPVEDEEQPAAPVEEYDAEYDRASERDFGDQGPFPEDGAPNEFAQEEDRASEQGQEPFPEDGLSMETEPPPNDGKTTQAHHFLPADSD
jgi:collagen type V/XI/XXIV/XXVII alpha